MADATPEFVVTTKVQRDAAMAAALAFDQAQAEASAEARRLFLAELKAVVGDARYTWLLEQVERLAPIYQLDKDVSLHIVPLPGFLSRLRDAVN